MYLSRRVRTHIDRAYNTLHRISNISVRVEPVAGFRMSRAFIIIIIVFRFVFRVLIILILYRLSFFFSFSPLIPHIYVCIIIIILYFINVFISRYPAPRRFSALLIYCTRSTNDRGPRTPHNCKLYAYIIIFICANKT